MRRGPLFLTSTLAHRQLAFDGSQTLVQFNRLRFPIIVDLAHELDDAEQQGRD